MNDGIVFNF